MKMLVLLLILSHSPLISMIINGVYLYDKIIWVTFCLLITFFHDMLQVKKMVVDSPRTFHEVCYQLIAEA